MSTYIKLATKSSMDAKVIAAGNEAWGACCRMIAWCGEHLTDGHIPDQLALMFAGSDEVLETLVRHGLVTRDSRGTKLVAFLKWNSSRAEVETKRKAAAARQRRKRTKDLAPSRCDTSVSHAAVTQPEDRRQKTEIEGGERARASGSPSDDSQGSTDPRAEAIAAALRASPKAAVIANPERYAEDLLGSLGAMALNVDPAELAQSVADALVVAEDGIREHPLRRLVRGYVRQTAKTPPGERSHRAVLDSEPQDDTRRRIGCGACRSNGDDGELVPQGNGTRQCNTCHRVVRVARRAS